MCSRPAWAPTSPTSRPSPSPTTACAGDRRAVASDPPRDRLVLVAAVDEDAVDDVDAQEEQRQRPPRVVAADRQQRRDRPEAAADEPDVAAVRVADHQREPAREL